MSSTPIDIPKKEMTKERSLSEQFDASSLNTKTHILYLTGTKPTSKAVYDSKAKEEEKRRIKEFSCTTPTTKSMLKFWGIYHSPPSYY